MEIQKKTQRLLRPVKENLSQWLNTVLKPSEQSESEPRFDPESSARLIFRDCLKVQASDLHLEPFSTGVKVRMRIDGVLHDTAVLSHEQGERLIRYYKTLAELDPVAAFKPQDARIQVQIENRRMDLRISCVPCQGGEKMVMRLMDPRKVDHRMQHLGLTDDDRGEIEHWLQNITGLCAVAGPTGSGKTTTLYALLHELKARNKSILTIEDPVEYEIDGITQIQVNHRHQLNFAEGLKAMMRLDPDYLLVGEMRDPESAKAGMEASSSGRVLLSTLHSRDTAGVVSSLRHWEIPDHEIATNLELVIAQRLVRRLCTECSRREAPTAYEAAWLKSLGESVPGKTWHAVGCKACFQTGYLGRTGVFEIWRKDEEDYELILSHADEGRLRRSLRERGRKSLLQDGLTKAFNGVTSLDEIQTMNFQTHMLTAPADKRNAKTSSSGTNAKSKSKSKSKTARAPSPRRK